MTPPEEKPVGLPFNTDAEAQLLGLLLRENALLDRLTSLETEHFYIPAHQRIFEAIREKINNGELATPVTLQGKFACDPDIKPAYLAQCAGVSGLPENAWNYAAYLRDLASRRCLIAACDEARKALASESATTSDVAASLSLGCEKIMAGGKRWEMRKGSVVTQEIIDDMKRNAKPYSTGISKIDKAMDGGLLPRCLYGFAGRQKSGKTILLSTISMNLAKVGVPHLFICAEMSDKQIHQRNLARAGHFYPSAFRDPDGYAQSDDFNRKLAESCNWHQDNIIYVNAPGLTFADLKAYVRSAVRNHGVKGYILDYWQLVGGQEKTKNTSEHLYEVAQWMAASTKMYDIFSIAAVQLNKEGTTFGSEGIRKSCDQLYEINRPVEDEPGMWLRMMDSRYTAYADIGSESEPGLFINGYGPYFEEAA